MKAKRGLELWGFRHPDVTIHIPVIALATATAQTPSGLRLLLMAADGPQEHMSSRVLMALSGAASAELVVQVRPKETQERLRPRVLCSWDWNQQLPGLFWVSILHVIRKRPPKHCFLHPGPTQ